MHNYEVIVKSTEVRTYLIQANDEVDAHRQVALPGDQLDPRNITSKDHFLTIEVHNAKPLLDA